MDDIISRKSHKYEPKLVSELINHLDQNKGIKTQDKHIHQLKNYGYYHAYKGYRFYKQPDNVIPYKQFEQLINVIDFDNELKSVFFSEIMFLETALKNIVVADVIEEVDEPTWDCIARTKMSEATERSIAKISTSINNSISTQISTKNPMVTPYRNNKYNIPIWIIFENISISTFAQIVCNMNVEERRKISHRINIDSKDDTNFILLTEIIYTLRAVRNPIAHNSVIFDSRFCQNYSNMVVQEFVEQEIYGQSFGGEKVRFDSIVDYYLLCVIMLCKIKYAEVKIKRFSKRMQGAYIFLAEQLMDEKTDDGTKNIFDVVVPTDTGDKLRKAKAYTDTHIEQVQDLKENN